MRSRPLPAFVAAAVLAACAADPVSHLGSDAGGGGPGPRPDADPDAPDSGSPPAVGCSGGTGGASQPFGNHAHGYAAGTLLPSHVSQHELDEAVRAFYDIWKAEYLRAGCGAGRYYVDVRGSDSATVSEAHGYGMLIAAYLAGYDPAARDIFDGLYRYFTDHPSAGSPDLMAWSQDHDCNDNQGAHSASDGDLDIAYALLLADKQWGSAGAIDYHAEALRVIHAIAWAEVDATGSWVRLGDWTDPGDLYYYEATRSSDFMPGHFASFEAAVGDGGWARLADRGYDMVASLQAGHAPSTGLLPDFILDPVSAPHPAPGNFLERPVDGAYSFNACRVPLRLGTAFVTRGDARARAAIVKIDDWLRGAAGDNPGNIAAGYWLDGDGLPGSGYSELAFIAPFAVGAMAGGDQVWLNNLWDTVRWRDATGVYYADTLKLLSMIVISGNWWTPEGAPCPE